MQHDHERTGWCGWIALGSITFLLQGLLPGSFIGGLEAAQSASGTEGSALLFRMAVLGGMIAGPLPMAVVVMALTMAVMRAFRLLFRSFPRSGQAHGRF